MIGMTCDKLTVDASLLETYHEGSTEERVDFKPASRNPIRNEKIMINVQGYRFETYRATLEKYPDTFLGSAKRRTQYYDHNKQEVCLNRDLDVFHCVLFFYQSQGILAKPAWTPEKVFIEELKFYLLDKFIVSPTEVTCDVHDKIVVKEESFRGALWQVLEEPYSSSLATGLVYVSIAVIAISVLTYCIETVPEIYEHSNPQIKNRNQMIFFVLESIFVTLFTIEYLARLYACPNRWKFLKSPMGFIDVCVILPYFVTVGVNVPTSSTVISLSFLRLLRLVRVLRVIKLTRYSKGMKILGRTLIESLSELKALFISLAIAITVSSSAVYYFEGYGYNNPHFPSIPDTFWFTIITMTTVGYGDVVPVTVCGKLSTLFCLLSGIIVLLCLPTPVFIAHFGRFYELFSSSRGKKGNAEEQTVE